MAPRHIRQPFLGTLGITHTPSNSVANWLILACLSAVHAQLSGIGNLPWEIRGNVKPNGNRTSANGINSYSETTGDNTDYDRESARQIAAQHLRIFSIGGTIFLLFFLMVIFVVTKEVIMRQRRLRQYRYEAPVPRLMVKDLTISHNKRRQTRGKSYSGGTISSAGLHRGRMSLRDARTGSDYSQRKGFGAGGKSTILIVNEKRRQSEHGMAASRPHNPPRHNNSALHLMNEGNKIVQLI